MPPKHARFSLARMTGPVAALGPAKSYARDKDVLPKKADCLTMTSSLMLVAAGFPLAAKSQHGFGWDRSR